MLKTIVPACLDFKDGVPYSAAYGLPGAGYVVQVMLKTGYDTD